MLETMQEYSTKFMQMLEKNMPACSLVTFLASLPFETLQIPPETHDKLIDALNPPDTWQGCGTYALAFLLILLGLIIFILPITALLVVFSEEVKELTTSDDGIIVQDEPEDVKAM